MIDCHVHTARCGHGEGCAAEYVAAAQRAGIEVLTFTEHLPLPEGLDPDNEYAMPERELAGYVAEVRGLSASSATAELSGAASPKILLGIEADWLPEHLDHVRRLLADQDLDVVLGSVHFLDGWAFDDPELLARWDKVDVDATWTRYFEVLAEAASSGLYDVMAHPDLVKKFGHRPSFDPGELNEEAASAFANAGVAIEVSTAGLRKPVGELYPGADFLAACARAGVLATVGSDAHRPSEVGYAFDVARDALLSAGYESIVYFEGRQMREVPL